MAALMGIRGGTAGGFGVGFGAATAAYNSFKQFHSFVGEPVTGLHGGIADFRIRKLHLTDLELSEIFSMHR